MKEMLGRGKVDKKEFSENIYGKKRRLTCLMTVMHVLFKITQRFIKILFHFYQSFS